MTMLGFLTIPYQWKISPSLSSSSSPFSLSTRSSLSFPLFKFPLHYSESQIPGKRKRFTALASNNDNGLGGNIKEREGERNGAKGSNGGDDLRKERGPVFNIKWAELLIDPDPDNILAVALTGLLAWASVQVLWQLFFISLAILVAALKYSFIAALLIFILITLL
ncbi:uncharacterized protein LOC111807677 [Cucurbita pepo subsp. pepo]|uniref:uncharacterized protein LOC111807677 n=1 Tax=Cucurbita pepo subsp. pepo TaxID=3664 RepID=UPI000C9DA353|nr:uncharacterized protein LOC111807677 [Cucurbita pepo subsp. pepo]